MSDLSNFAYYSRRVREPLKPFDYKHLRLLRSYSVRKQSQ